MIYGYIRVSTVKQANEGNSLEGQTKLLLENGVPQENIFQDTYTGTKDQYTGTINDGTDSYFGLTVNNTKGFELPSTGGAGILLFVLAGAIVLAAGCGYYVASSRKNRGK